jgi:Glycosyl hydrolase family 9.
MQTTALCDRKSVTATLDFAASMAQASRVFAPFEKDYPEVSQKMLQASIRAFNWALQHPDALYNQRKMNATSNRQFQPVDTKIVLLRMSSSGQPQNYI